MSPLCVSGPPRCCGASPGLTARGRCAPSMSDNIRHKAFPKAKLAQFIDRTSFFLHPGATPCGGL
ncbi:hypothetical protein BCEP4_540077 [Burkholderia cepacia]|nr:hypothetical protein BCEP4_540077 [Burkholderia cepacia]